MNVGVRCALRNIVTWRARNTLPSCTKCLSRQLHITPLTHKTPQVFLSVSPQSYFLGVIISRYYAKGKDKKKSDKGHKKKVEVDEEMLAEVIKVDTMKTQMEKSIQQLKDDYVKNLSLRSAAGSVESLPVSFEGKEYTLEELAQVVRKNPKTIIVHMASFPQAIPAVIQAFSKSGMNLNPQQDGTTLYIPVPKVTKEHREMLSKNAKALFIKCRDHIKDAQNKFNKTVKQKEKDGLSQDVSKQITEQINFISGEYIAQAEKIMEAKQQELIGES